MIFCINTTRDISKLSQISLASRLVKLRITILKYHSWYLYQISLQIMLLPIQFHNSYFDSASHVTSHFKTIHSYIVLRCRATYLQVSLGGIEELAKRKEEVRVACGLPASYELQCPPQQPIDNERIPAPHTPPPGSDSDSNGEIIWDRSEEEPQEQRHRPPKPRPKVRY